MNGTILPGIFVVANAFIAVFIVIYAFLFLKKTKSHKDRRPWDYLFLASIVYATYTMFLMLIQINGQEFIFGSVQNFQFVVSVFQFVFTGFILLSFISQTDLIINNDLIIIMKKTEQAIGLRSVIEQATKEKEMPAPVPVQSAEIQPVAQMSAPKKTRAKKQKAKRKKQK